MTKEERTLLLAAIALGIGRGPTSAYLNPEDRALLDSLIGGNDWATIFAKLMPLVRAAASDGQ